MLVESELFLSPYSLPVPGPGGQEFKGLSQPGLSPQDPEQDLPERVAQEIAFLYQNPATRIFMLPGTGFDMGKQIETWINTYFSGQRAGESFTEVKQQLIEKTLQDIEGFYWEYLARRMVLPIRVARASLNGQPRLIAPNYGDSAQRPYEDLVKIEERDGVVRKAIAGMAELMAKAPPGTVAMITSPPGWSGLRDSEGNLISYQESQTYVFRIREDGTPEGLTLRTDMILREHERLVALLDGKFDSSELPADVFSRIKNVAGQVTVFQETAGENGFHRVLRAIKAVKTSPYTLIDRERDEMRTFEEMAEDIDATPILDGQVRLLLDHFRAEVERNLENLSPQAVRQLVIMTGRTLLAISRFSSQAQERFTGQLSTIGIRTMGQSDYLQELAFMQTMSGCNGGGKTIFSQAFGLRTTLTNKKEKGSVECCGLSLKPGSICPLCGAMV